MASEVKSFCCTNCGAPLEVSKGHGGKVTCPYCKTVCVIEDFTQNAQIKEKNNINSGLPLTVPQDRLHTLILKELTAEPGMPLDVLENVTVQKEEHLCIPAYVFYCNAMGSFTYEVGNERKRVVDKKEETYTEWSHQSSMTSAAHTVIVSGSKEQEELVETLYADLSPSSLVDVESLDFPADTESFSYDLPEVAAFSQYAKPVVEKQLQKQAEQQVAGGQTRNFNMGGINVQKDSAVRILLGVYHLVYTYQDQTYEIYVSADGGKHIASGHPVDAGRKEKYAALQKEIKELDGRGVGMILLGIIALLAAFAFWPLLILGAILLVVGVRRTLKYIKLADAKKEELKEFMDQRSNAINNFAQCGKPLNGVYVNLPLDAEALAFAAAKAYTVIVPLEFKKLTDINDKIKVTNAITKAGVDKKHAKDFYAGKSQTIAEGIDIEQAEKMQEELQKSGIEIQVIPQKE